MGYNIKQKIEICLHSEANPLLTQMELAEWARQQYGLDSRACQTTILRILSSKSSILGARESDFSLVRRRKQSNPLLRQILTEWVTQAQWQRIPITTPIIQLTANAIWNKLPAHAKEGNGVFSQKWCIHFIRRLNLNMQGSADAIQRNLGHLLDRVWKLDEKLELKSFVRDIIRQGRYTPQDLFVVDEFSLFYSLPLDQIFDVSSVLKGLLQTSKQSEAAITVLLACNFDGLEKLSPLVVSDAESLELSASTLAAFKSHGSLLGPALANKVQEVYQVGYKTNKTKWITLAMFQDYLLSLDHKLAAVSPERQILMFLDDSSSHRIISMEFRHIRLVFLENSAKHKNLHSGTKFDYLPMSFGIVEEFKTLYRLQQYLEMINKQRNTQPAQDQGLYDTLAPHDSAEILSETDYNVPLIKAIEWIKRAWDSLSHEKIYLAWRRSLLVSVREPWPLYSGGVQQSAAVRFGELLAKTHLTKSYDKLHEIMEYLNVVIPWEIDELLSLVNERTKATLTYASIDEMIDSCALTGEKEPEPKKAADYEMKNPTMQINAFQAKLPPMAMVPPRVVERKTNMDALLRATNSRAQDPFEYQNAPSPNKSHTQGTLEIIQNTHPLQNTLQSTFPNHSLQMRVPLPDFRKMEAFEYPVNNLYDANGPVDVELVAVLNKVLEASQNKRIKLSAFAVEELNLNLATIKHRVAVPGSNSTA